MQEKEDLRLWKQFKTQAKLSNDQLNQFKHYLELLISWNEKFNITAITSPRLVIKHHFLDSLALGEHYDLTKSLLICDIGTGGGLPGLALKIKYPHLKVILIEVSKKKGLFLEEVIKELGLEDIEICDLDFRTFIRTMDADIDLFISRASLDPEELCRLFKPGCRYKNAILAYWASGQWEPSPAIEPLIDHIKTYSISSKRRKLVFFKKK